MSSEDINKRVFEESINHIHEIITSWGPLPEKPDPFIDDTPFVKIGRNLGPYLKRSGDQIIIHTSNNGDFEISVAELSSRMLIGQDYVDHLIQRLDAFHDLLFASASADK